MEPVFTTARHRSLSWAKSIQSTLSHPVSLICILVLSSHTRLGFPSGLFPSGVPTKTLYAFPNCPLHATSPGHLILLDLIWCNVYLWSCSLCSFLQPPAISSLLCWNVKYTKKKKEIVLYMIDVRFLLVPLFTTHSFAVIYIVMAIHKSLLELFYAKKVLCQNIHKEAVSKVHTREHFYAFIIHNSRKIWHSIPVTF